MRTLQKTFSLQTVLLLSTALLSTLSANSAFATYYKKQSYSHCGSSSQSNEQSNVCNSPLGEYTYDLVDDKVTQTNQTNNSFVQIDGLNISMSAFSDTQGVTGETVVGAKLEKISDKWAYGITNNDEAYYRGGADHAIDNLNYFSSGSDNSKNYRFTNVERDYDFILLSFDSAVTLTGASFSWLYDSRDSQVSVAALSNTAKLTSGVNTWSHIVEDALTSASFDIESCEYLDHRADFTFTESAQYWLVGAYNTVFGNIGGEFNNDAFKLANIGFSVTETAGTPDPTKVSEPGTIGLLMACSLFVMWRRKKTI
ncbi:PEP-CTERM sorting domain-containing protein [Alteromonas sp. Cnat3-28]|uniref:exosortase-dependent surface protein XDP1 n=1 Tax=Alteromonas sp. Cnat3-28 TaxID=2917729 RepID=UPI001EF58B45|nr:exosortase-dependent surface protein XDP1 [Alteromonas sp. Cnat3-28]MCG7647596.1 PEP-CTERM sorting domain-containing protein [Alteromonas sp. Cnat3-28]